MQPKMLDIILMNFIAQKHCKRNLIDFNFGKNK